MVMTARDDMIARWPMCGPPTDHPDTVAWQSALAARVTARFRDHADRRLRLGFPVIAGERVPPGAVALVADDHDGKLQVQVFRAKEGH